MIIGVLPVATVGQSATLVAVSSAAITKMQSTTTAVSATSSPAAATFTPKVQVSSAGSALLTDFNIHTEPTLPSLPAAGGTMLDTVFGVTIMRLTDSNDGTDCRVEYSYWSSFNVDSTKVKAVCIVSGTERTRIWNFNPTTFARGTQLAVMPFPQISFDPIWSGINTDVLYGHSHAGVLYSYNVVSAVNTSIKDFTSLVPSGGRLAQMSMSEDDDRFAFHYLNSSSAVVGYLVWDRSSNTVILNEPDTGGIDEVQLDKTGQYLVVIYTSGNGKVWNLSTLTTTSLTYGTNGFFHRDVGHGNLFSYNGPRNGLCFRSLATPTTLVQLQALDSGHATAHFCMRADDETWALTSYYNNNGSGVSAAFDNEIWQTKTNVVSPGQVRRICHHRSVFNEYFDSPFATISRDGRFVSFSSNWGSASGRRDVFVARIS